MFVYRVVKCADRSVEAEMNRLEADGWLWLQLATTWLLIAIIVTYEGKK